MLPPATRPAGLKNRLEEGPGWRPVKGQWVAARPDQPCGQQQRAIGLHFKSSGSCSGGFKQQ